MYQTFCCRCPLSRPPDSCLLCVLRMRCRYYERTYGSGAGKGEPSADHSFEDPEHEQD